MKGSILAVAIAVCVLVAYAVVVLLAVAALNADFGWAIIGISASFVIIGAAIAGYDR